MLNFFFNTTKDDLKLSFRLIKQISEFYPDSKILCVTDGLVEEAEELKTLSPNLILVEGERLKNFYTVGQFTQRNLTSILENLESENIIKLDPDSYIFRRFSYIPNEEWCGEVNTSIFNFGKSIWARGGCFLIKRNAIKLIVDSELLLHPYVQKIESFEIQQNKVYEDFRLGYVANFLGIYPTQWNEVNCRRFSIRDRRFKSFAVSHPVKSLMNL